MGGVGNGGCRKQSGVGFSATTHVKWNNYDGTPEAHSLLFELPQ